MKTYYIVKHVNERDEIIYKAHKQGILTLFNIYNYNNAVLGSFSLKSADDCEARLRRVLNPIKPEVIRAVSI